MRFSFNLIILVFFQYSCQQPNYERKSEIEKIISQKNDYKLFFGYRISQRGPNCYWLRPNDSNYTYIINEKNGVYSFIKEDYYIHESYPIKQPSPKYLRIVDAYKKNPALSLYGYNDNGVEILELNLGELNYVYYIPDISKLSIKKEFG